MKSRIAFTLFVACLILLNTLALAQINDASTVYNDATQGRLRLGHLVYNPFNSPNVDLLVDGEVVVISDRPQANMPYGTITPYLYLAPGSYSVAVVPTGKAIGEAILGPLDVEVAAGHRYLVAMLGQVEDASLKPLVIDETAALQEARTDPSQQLLMMINNVAGTTTIDFNVEGSGPHDIEYGGFAVSNSVDGDDSSCEDFVIAFDDTEVVSEPAPVYCDPAEPEPPVEPGMDFVVAFMGRAGVERIDWEETQGPNFSDLNAREFLEQFSGLGYEQNGVVFSFDTFLAVVDKAGLADLLTTGGPFLMFIPTDDAFAALPDGELDALMADPEALADLLRYHIVEGYYARGTLNNGEDYSGVDRTLTNMAGEDLELLSQNGALSINGVFEQGVQSYMVPSGTRLQPMSQVLMPPAD